MIVKGGDTLAPSATVMEEGTAAREGSELDSAMTAPPAGAGESTSTVLEVVGAPPTAETGASARVNRFATETVIAADRPAAATLVAVIVTSAGAEIVAGAVYKPVDEMVPTSGERDHVTRWSAAPMTVAVNCAV